MITFCNIISSKLFKIRNLFRTKKKLFKIKSLFKISMIQASLPTTQDVTNVIHNVCSRTDRRRYSEPHNGIVITIHTSPPQDAAGWTPPKLTHRVLRGSSHAALPPQNQTISETRLLFLGEEVSNWSISEQEVTGVREGITINLLCDLITSIQTDSRVRDWQHL